MFNNSETWNSKIYIYIYIIKLINIYNMYNSFWNYASRSFQENFHENYMRYIIVALCIFSNILNKQVSSGT